MFAQTNRIQAQEQRRELPCYPPLLGETVLAPLPHTTLANRVVTDHSASRTRIIAPVSTADPPIDPLPFKTLSRLGTSASIISR